MNAAQRNRHVALLKVTGFEDAPALTVQSTDGEIPHGRELSFAWLAGTVMTGLTSVMMMGAALYVSFQGQDTFSTAYEALQLAMTPEAQTPSILEKTDRLKPVQQTRSELEIVEASIRETINGRDMIRKQPFVRIRATLATSPTALSENIPEFDPVALIAANQPIEAADNDPAVSTDIYGAEVEGEVAVTLAALPLTAAPPRAINDMSAAMFVRASLEDTFSFDDSALLSYAATGLDGLRDLAPTDGIIRGIAENVSVVPKTILAEDATLGRTERIVTLRAPTPLSDALARNGFSDAQVAAVMTAVKNVIVRHELPERTRLRILFGPDSARQSLIPYRLSIYSHNLQRNTDTHAATVALTDNGQYVLGIAPAAIEFPEEDTEEINVGNLPTIYRAIWETGRKHELTDATIERILAMYAYDVDLSKRITAGDSIEILESQADAAGDRELLYVSLRLGTTERELFRYRTQDGVVDFYDQNGETGKRFLTRRPLQGGGRLSSRFGSRVHPIFKSRRMHTGVDLAAPSGTPIYAAGDGVVERAQWVSGYGRFVELKHVNGFETGYGHMSRIHPDIKPGVRVRQGQIIGYVGSTGNSTGNHLHFEIKINDNFVDPLSVKLPRDKTLPVQYERQFEQTIAQIRDLMQRDALMAPSPGVTVASVN